MFIKTAVEQKCQIIACSALLSMTMGELKAVVDATKRAGIRDKVKIMVGGAPVTQEFCDQIRADCYAPDATSAAEAAVELCGM
jgi:methanogenic corrinoid protein MtbC1